MSNESKPNIEDFIIGTKVPFKYLGKGIIVKRARTTMMSSPNLFMKGGDGKAYSVIKKNERYVNQNYPIEIAPNVEVEIVAFL